LVGMTESACSSWHKVMSATKLPKFKKPPVVEAFCGISFQELYGLHAPQLGELWNAIRRDYPKIDTQPPIAPAPPPNSSQQIIFQIGAPTQFRTWFMNDDNSILLQIQRDRLILNWRKSDDSSIYPSYTVLRRRFEKALNTFSTFIGKQNIGTLQLTGIEFGYVNLITLPRELTSIENFNEVFPILIFDKKSGILQSLSALNFQARFELPEKGQLHASIFSAQKPTDGSPALRFDLVSRWFSPQMLQSDMLPWLDMAHEMTVKTFVFLTSRQMQEVEWERYR